MARKFTYSDDGGTEVTVIQENETEWSIWLDVLSGEPLATLSSEAGLMWSAYGQEGPCDWEGDPFDALDAWLERRSN